MENVLSLLRLEVRFKNHSVKMKNYLYYIYWVFRTWPQRRNFPRLKIMTIEETVDDIIGNKKSISRFGDGEFLLLLKKRDLAFQRLDVILCDKLLQVLNNRNPKLCVAIPDSLNSRKGLEKYAKIHWLLFINTYSENLAKLFDRNYNYGNSNMTRIYAGMKDKAKSKQYFDKIKTIWENQEVLIIEGELSRLGVGNDLFDKAKKVERIICPNINAFAKYNEIKESAYCHGKGKLILVGLGPTATVLCSELCNGGFWAIDVGHIDVEYMWMLLGVKQRTSIKGRFVNESNNVDGFELDTHLIEPYRKSIILDLSNPQL